MGKLARILAVVGLMAAPALADLEPSQYNPTQANLTPTGQRTVGVFGSAYVTGYGMTPVIFYDFNTVAGVSDTVHLTFAFHWPYTTDIYAVQAWHSFVYDNTEIEVVSMTPAGVFAGGVNNYSAFSQTWWPNPGTGMVTVGDVLGTGVPLWGNPAAGKAHVTESGIIPFMQVDLHVRGINPDTLMDVFVGSFALLFQFTSASPSTFWTAGNVGMTTYGMGVVPEPASLSLLGLGLASIGAGVWRRRRR